MANPTIQFKRGQAANVGLASFKAGEPGFTTDKYDFYIGLDGTHTNQKFFGSSRYWDREDGTSAAQLKLVDKDGSNSINFQAPDTLSGIATWILPAYNAGAQDEFLKITSASGNQITLDWAAVPSGSFTIAADSGSDDTFTTGETLTFAGTASEIETTVSNNQIQIGLPDNVVVGGGLTATTFTLAGVAVTAILDEDDLTSDRADALATQQSIKAYVDNNSPASSIDIDGDTGTASVSTGATFAFDGTSPVNIAASGAGVTFSVSDATTSAKGIASFDSGDFGVSSGAVTLADTVVKSISTGSGSVAPHGHSFTIAGTANEIETSGNLATVTIGLPNDVTIANNLTVTNNLYVQGSTTQVDTTSLTIEDRTIELGMVDGAAPTSTTTWDLGVLFNYYSGSAKKAAVAWEQSDSRFKFASVVTGADGTGVGDPQLTFTTMASIEISSLFINDTAGTHEVIKYDTGSSQRVLLDITVDAGTF